MIYTQFNFEFKPDYFEENSQVSMTVPDHTMSLKTIVTKYAKGLPISAPIYNGIYTDEDLAIDHTKLDFADQERIEADARREYNELRQTLTEQQKEALKAKEAETEALKRELAELKAKQQISITT